MTRGAAEKVIAIVGSSLGGVRTARALRRFGHRGRIVIIGEERELPYDRPPLSKRYLSDPASEPRLLEPEEFYADIELRLGSRAQRLRLDERAVLLDDGSQVVADEIVIATGSRARELPGTEDLEQFCTLRTREDADQLRATLEKPDRRILILGGGFIGCEVAATALGRGAEVTLVEPQRTPMLRGVGDIVGATMADVHRRNGVIVRTGTTVLDLSLRHGSVRAELSDGSVAEADLVVVGIGAVPCTDWLAGSDIRVGNGIHCDDKCRALGGGGHVWAVGDVASWPSALYGERVRVEHWTNAVEQASAVASGILGDPELSAFDPVPYVWSDQFGGKIQVFGTTEGADETEVLDGHLEEDGYIVGYARDGVLRGVVARSRPRDVSAYEELIARRATLAEARSTALR